jgi:hypothetical protein
MLIDIKEYNLLKMCTSDDNLKYVLGGMHCNLINKETIRLETVSGRALYVFTVKPKDKALIEVIGGKIIKMPNIKKSVIEVLMLNDGWHFPDRKEGVYIKPYEFIDGKFPRVDMFLLDSRKEKKKRVPLSKVGINTELLPSKTCIGLEFTESTMSDGSDGIIICNSLTDLETDKYKGTFAFMPMGNKWWKNMEEENDNSY